MHESTQQTDQSVVYFHAYTVFLHSCPCNVSLFFFYLRIMAESSPGDFIIKCLYWATAIYIPLLFFSLNNFTSVGRLFFFHSCPAIISCCWISSGWQTGTVGLGTHSPPCRWWPYKWWMYMLWFYKPHCVCRYLPYIKLAIGWIPLFKMTLSL